MRRRSTSAAAAVAIATVLGFPSCDDSKRSEAGVNDARATRACLEEAHPWRKSTLTGWLVSEPKKGKDGEYVTVSVLMVPKDAANSNSVNLLFEKSSSAARAEYRRVAKLGVLPLDARLSHRVLQRRANVVLVWTSPETTRQQIASVMRCLRSRPRQ